jgi:hypothetical protein
MPKSKSELPVLTIHDGADDSKRTYISKTYVRTALQGIQIMALHGNANDVAEEAKRLIAEIDRQA